MDEKPLKRIYMININHLKEKFKPKLIFKNENLSKYSWFNLGGNAEIFFRPDSKLELMQTFIKKLNLTVIVFSL